MSSPKRPRVIFVCQQCGAQSVRWAGRCAECNAWNSLVESFDAEHAGNSHPSQIGGSVGAGQPIGLRELRARKFDRLALPFDELNRVLGGGIVPGSVTLLGGDPGVGKSTLVLQASAAVAQAHGSVLYVSGEESAEQVKMRADRLGIDAERLFILAETQLDQILTQIDALGPSLVVIDSIQTVFLESVPSAAGSVTQVRECAMALLRQAKSAHRPVFLVGHVTKEGAIAGPRVLEHIVDTVLYLEGERFQSLRILRGVKNRFGSTHEVGVFEMVNEGLIEVVNPSEMFLAERPPNADGTTVAVTIEGTRPILIEIQALTATTAFGLPRRTATGIDMGRLLLLTAVLSKRVGLGLSNQDIYVNVVGGFRVGEPAVDLAVAVAIASSFRDRPVDPQLAIIGEVGLSGELRRVSHPERRLGEVAKLGFRRCLLPRSVVNERLNRPPGIELLPAATVDEALETALDISRAD